MKKLLLLVTFTLLLSGCSTIETYHCTIDDREAVITLKDGFISKYVLDTIKIKRAEIDEINGAYFTGVSSPEDGKKALINFVQSSGGHCDFE